MLDYQGYQPVTAYSNYTSPEDVTAQMMQPMVTSPVKVEAVPQPAMTQNYRKPADTLHNFYLAWEQAKTAEIHEQYMASRYYHGKQWTDAEIRELKRRKQPVTTKNRIKRKVDFLVGVEQRLRRDPKCYPRTPVAEKAAYVATSCLRQVEDETKWPAIASAATKDALIRGIGVVWQGAKLVKGRPEVRKAHIPADRFFYDPCSEQLDFSDVRFLGEWQWLDMDQAAELLPFASKMIETLATAGAEGSLSVLPQEFDKSKNWQTWIDTRKRLIRITSIWYRCHGKWMYDYLVGPVSLCPPEMDCVSPYQGDDDENEHPYQAWSPYIDERGDRYGVVRDMMPLQDGINKRSSKMLHMLNVRQVVMEKGAVDDVEKARRELASPDGVIERNKGFEFETVDQTAQTQGQFELLQEDKAEIENLGPNPGLIGRGVENQSGRAILAQQNSGMTELSPVFECCREWKLKVYNRDWRLIRQFWSGERYIRVTADPRSVEFLSINRVIEDPMTGQIQMENALAEMEVDVILDEGPDTVTLREELMDNLAQLGPQAVPAEILIEMSDWPEKDVLLKRLQEAKSPPPELMEMQKRMGALEELLKAAQVDKQVADTDAQRATTMKTLAEISAPKPAPAAGGSAKPAPGGKPVSTPAPVAPQRDSGVIANDLLLTSRLMSELYPIYYREPSVFDTVKMSPGPGEQMAPPPNAMMPDSGPEGMPMDGGAPQMPNPMMAQEPQLDAPGGLPLGPGVGP